MVGLRGETENRVFHRRCVVLRDDIRDVEDEEVFLGMSDWKQSHATQVRRFSLHREPKVRHIENRPQVPSRPNEIRHIGNPYLRKIHSLVSEPKFVSFGTKVR